MQPDLFDLSGKTALITGASSGLGAHFARVLLDAGAAVVLAARRTDRLEALAAELRKARGGEARVVRLDVSDRASVDAAVAEAAAQRGLDIVVNNAGIADTQPFLEMSDESFDRIVDVNLGGVFRVGQAAARVMAAGQGGSIVNIASVLGFVVQPTQAAYAASKAAVVHLTRSMALELRDSAIRVNAIAPGYFGTEINEKVFATERGQGLAKRLFPRRVGELQELNGTLLLLASGAGSYINGTTITVDGGTMLSGV